MLLRLAPARKTKDESYRLALFDFRLILIYFNCEWLSQTPKCIAWKSFLMIWFILIRKKKTTYYFVYLSLCPSQQLPRCTAFTCPRTRYSFPRYIIPQLIAMGFFGFILYSFISAGFFEPTALSLSKTFVLIFTLGIALFLSVNNGLMTAGLANLDSPRSKNVNNFLLPLVVLVVTIFYLFLQLLLRDFYITILQIIPVVVLLFAYNVMFIVVYMFLCYLNLVLMMDELAKLENKPRLGLTDINRFIKAYQNVKRHGELPTLMLFISAQGMLIITLFMSTSFSGYKCTYLLFFIQHVH